MGYKGVNGERIVGLHFTFQRHPNGNRIIGFLIRTNYGQERDISSWALFTTEAPPETETFDETFQCGIEEDIVGFQYVSGVSTKFSGRSRLLCSNYLLQPLHVHDISVITRPKAQRASASFDRY